MRFKFSKILFVFALLLLNTPARADLAFVMTPAMQSGAGRNEVFFTGTLTNNEPACDLFLNNLQIGFNGSASNYLAADTNVFFFNVPGVLCPQGTYTDVVFGVTIDPSIPPGQYCGTVTIQGGSNICELTNLSSQTFPVACSAATLGVALCGTNLSICWSSPPGSFVLQQNCDLMSTNWTTVTNTPTLSSGLNQVILAPANATQFFRLQYP